MHTAIRIQTDICTPLDSQDVTPESVLYTTYRILAHSLGTLSSPHGIQCLQGALCHRLLQVDVCMLHQLPALFFVITILPLLQWPVLKLYERTSLLLRKILKLQCPSIFTLQGHYALTFENLWT